MPAAPRAPQDLADAVFRVGRAYGMTADRSIYQAVAVKGGRITAVGRSRDELDSFIGPGTAVIDDPELVLYPAFGILAPGAFADVVGFRADLLDCPVDDLPSQQPALTLVGGRPVHDLDGLLGSAGSA